MISLPSFALRMIAIFTAMAFLKNRSFIDQPTFALVFGLAVTAVIVLEARGWKRTPWLALTLTPAKALTTTKEKP
jgi:4-hydroxybenzoate polyprenyltransferase